MIISDQAPTKTGRIGKIKKEGNAKRDTTKRQKAEKKKIFIRSSKEREKT